MNMVHISSENIEVFPVLNRDPDYYESSRSLSGNNLQKWADASSRLVKYWTNNGKDCLFVNGLYIEIQNSTISNRAYIYVMDNLDDATSGLDINSEFIGLGFLEKENDAETENYPDTYTNIYTVEGSTYTYTYTAYSLDDLKNPISEIICDKF